MQSVLLILSKVEASLNRALAEYEAASDADSQEFLLLKVQALIFYCDVAAGIVRIGRNNPQGFARAVALKSLVHSLYEYDQQMNHTLVPRIIRYAARRKKAIDTSSIRTERRKWRDQLAKLKAWKTVRDAATGHYGSDIEQQIRLLETIREEEVFSVVSAISDYNAFILMLLPHRKRSDANPSYPSTAPGSGDGPSNHSAKGEVTSPKTSVSKF